MRMTVLRILHNMWTAWRWLGPADYLTSEVTSLQSTVNRKFLVERSSLLNKLYGDISGGVETWDCRESDQTGEPQGNGINSIISEDSSLQSHCLGTVQPEIIKKSSNQSEVVSVVLIAGGGEVFRPQQRAAAPQLSLSPPAADSTLTVASRMLP